MFSGLVYCMDCGSTMTLSRAHTMPESQYNFTCQNHSKNGRDVCSPHYIREKILAAVVLDDIRRITHFARQNKESIANVARFIDMAKKYGQIDELTPEILRTFVRRIEVGERGKKYSRTTTREIKIYYREIGLVDDPPQRMAVEDAAKPQRSQEIA